MRFTETRLNGVFIIEPEPIEDERGFFARTFCIREFKAHGLDPCVAQSSLSYNKKKGTLRGMHYQIPPNEETKLVRCTSGSIYDVIVDLRPTSSTFKRWISVVLTEENRTMLYIPKGFAHGFQTLEDETEVFYQMSEFFDPACARGLPWDDATLSISWLMQPTVISRKDQSFLPLTFHRAGD